MRQDFDNATIKIWFSSGASRNFYYVSVIERRGDTLSVNTSGGALYIVNWGNVTMIEEVPEE